MREPITIAGRAGILLLAATGLCAAQSYGPNQAPPTSRYPDGTGNSAVDGLNAGQLDQNYRGPWHEIPASRVRPGYAAPVYPRAAYPQAPYPQAGYPPGTYPQGGYPQPAYPPPPGYR